MASAADPKRGEQARQRVGQPILIDRPSTHTLRPLSPKLPSGEQAPNDLQGRFDPTSAYEEKDGDGDEGADRGDSGRLMLEPGEADPASTSQSSHPFSWADQEIPPLSTAEDAMDWQPEPNREIDGTFLSEPPTLKAVSKTTVAKPIVRPGINDAATVLRLDQVTLRDKQSILLGDLSFDLLQGELLGVAGIGARASHQLFEAILGARKPAEGTIACPKNENQPTLKHTDIGWLRLHHAAMVHDPWPLLGAGASSIDILSHAAQVLGCVDPLQTAQRFENLVGLTGATPSSAGWRLPYRIRLTTALVLMSNPKLLLIDHPTRDLGGDSALWLWNVLEQFQDETGACMLLASNNLGELERLCDRILLLQNGRVRMQAAPIDLKIQIGDHDLQQTYLEPADFER